MAPRLQETRGHLYTLVKHKCIVLHSRTIPVTVYYACKGMDNLTRALSVSVTLMPPWTSATQAKSAKHVIPCSDNLRAPAGAPNLGVSQKQKNIVATCGQLSHARRLPRTRGEDKKEEAGRAVAAGLRGLSFPGEAKSRREATEHLPQSSSS